MNLSEKGRQARFMRRSRHRQRTRAVDDTHHLCFHPPRDGAVMVVTVYWHRRNETLKKVRKHRVE